jgi:aminoglycoside phosphotransferase (APT) family kinase protein
VGSGPSRSFEVAFVQDHEHRRWVIRCPRTPAASARLEQSAALLALLARRLTMPVPVVKGWVALPEGGRAAVHAYLTGRAIDLASIAPGSPLAVGLGRALAHLHNLDRRVYEEAGVPVYEAEAYRTRRLAELDRAAATGRVPTGLLTRWEHTLEDVSLWRFTTTPTHGGIGSSTILATPDDGEDPDVKSLLGWESAQVADPADDLAALVGELHPDSLDTVLEAYAHARSDRPDQHLQERARLVHQMQLVRTMMSAVAAGDDDGAEEHARQLRRLDDRLAREDEERAAAAKPVVRPAAPAATSSDTPPETGAEAASSEAASSEAGSSETEAPGRSQNDTAAGADQTGGEEGHTAAGQDQTVAGDGDEEAAVEVETTGAPTPVEVPASDTSGAAPKDSDAGPATASGDTMTRGSDSATTDLTSSSDGSPTTDTAPVPHLVRDHETAEIVPLTGDEGDDVLPPSPRR